MKAFEVRQGTIDPQYDSIMGFIEESRKEGFVAIKVSPILPEVKNRLLENGFNLEAFYNLDNEVTSIGISWEDSKEGKPGIYEEFHLSDALDSMIEDVMGCIIFSPSDDGEVEDSDPFADARAKFSELREKGAEVSEQLASDARKISADIAGKVSVAADSFAQRVSNKDSEDSYHQ